MSDNPELTVAERLDRAEAIVAVQNLVASYCHAIDKRDLESFGAIWHTDARWQSGPDWFVGTDAILEQVQKYWSGVSETHHLAGNLVIEVDGESANSIVDAYCVRANTAGEWVRITATYTDRFARRAGEWRLIERASVIHGVIPIAVPA